MKRWILSLVVAASMIGPVDPNAHAQDAVCPSPRELAGFRTCADVAKADLRRAATLVFPCFYEMVLAALKAGKHVVCEKPLTSSILRRAIRPPDWRLYPAGEATPRT